MSRVHRARVARSSVLAPLLLYLIIPLRAPEAPYAARPDRPGPDAPPLQADLAGFLRYVSGQGFSGALLGVGEAPANAGTGCRLFAGEADGRRPGCWGCSV